MAQSNILCANYSTCTRLGGHQIGDSLLVSSQHAIPLSVMWLTASPGHRSLPAEVGSHLAGARLNSMKRFDHIAPSHCLAEMRLNSASTVLCLWTSHHLDFQSLPEVAMLITTWCNQHRTPHKFFLSVTSPGETPNHSNARKLSRSPPVMSMRRCYHLLHPCPR